MNRYFIHLAYKGTNYNGWQIQPKSPSVQETLQNAMNILLKQEIWLTGCGRTDTGVHARNFYAHFDCKPIKYDSVKKIVYKLNRILPSDIRVYGIFGMQNDNHCRFDAVKRTYRYYISREKEVFSPELVWQYAPPLNIDLMNKAALKLLDFEDFTSFSKLHTDVKTNNCKVFHANWSLQNELLIFEISADRFLRNMVRAIVGTLIEVGKMKTDVTGFCEIIEKKDRTFAGTSVPASGLFLENIAYPYPIPTLTSDQT